MNLDLVGHYSVDNIARIQNRPIYGLNVNVSLVMEFLDMTLKGETFSRIVSNFCLDGLCIFTKCNDFLEGDASPSNLMFAHA